MFLSNKKLESVIHYICSSCEDTSKLGATKLNKILFYADKEYFIKHGKTLTGAKYLKRQYGPVPDEVVQSVTRLQSAQKINVANVDYYNTKKTEYICLQQPNLSDLEKEEIDLLSRITDHICDTHTATSVSDATHEIVWESAAMGEEIPMGAYLVSNPAEITKKDMDWADTVLPN